MATLNSKINARWLRHKAADVHLGIVLPEAPKRVCLRETKEAGILKLR